MEKRARRHGFPLCCYLVNRALQKKPKQTNKPGPSTIACNGESRFSLLPLLPQELDMCLGEGKGSQKDPRNNHHTVLRSALPSKDPWLHYRVTSDEVPASSASFSPRTKSAKRLGGLLESLPLHKEQWHMLGMPIADNLTSGAAGLIPMDPHFWKQSSCDL